MKIIPAIRQLESWLKDQQWILDFPDTVKECGPDVRDILPFSSVGQ
jgi:hypothetical protein